MAKAPNPLHSQLPQPQEGYTAGLRFMSHLWDELPASYRPLAFYAFTESLGVLTRAALWVRTARAAGALWEFWRAPRAAACTRRPPPPAPCALPGPSRPQGQTKRRPNPLPAEPLQAAGFRRHDVCGRVFYTLDAAPWLSPAAGDVPREAPVLFLHGVGGGLLPYLGVIFDFAASGGSEARRAARRCPPALLCTRSHFNARPERRLRAPRITGRRGAKPSRQQAPKPMPPKTIPGCGGASNQKPTQPPLPRPLPPPGRAVIAPEYRHCSMRLCDDIPTVEDLAHSAHTFMAALGHERVGTPARGRARPLFARGALAVRGASQRRAARRRPQT